MSLRATFYIRTHKQTIVDRQWKPLLSLLEDIEEVATEKAVLDLIVKKRRQIERKLYQQPPLLKSG